MNNKHEMDEYLEALWCMQENGKKSMEEMRSEIGGVLNSEVLDRLLAEGLADISDDKTVINLTEKGMTLARRIIRAHRLAERLLYDAMGMNKDFEKGACEFEHIITNELVNSICIMLGHPTECPHGLPIPPGDCCLNSVKTIESSVVHLPDMRIGQAARIAYINCGEDQELHRLNGLQIRPGAMIRLHQTYPAFVVECEGANIAIDDEIAQNICVWQVGTKRSPSQAIDNGTPKKKSLWSIAFGR